MVKGVIASTFFPLCGKNSILVVVFVENGEKARCQDITSVTPLNTSRVSV